MAFYKNDPGWKSGLPLRIGFTILTLCLLSNIGAAAERLAPVIPLHGDHSRPNVCTDSCYSETCGEEAMRFVNLMDEEVDPCENFYEFACGGYVKSQPPGKESSVMDDAQGNISQDTFDEIYADIEDTDSEAFKKVKTYFQNCINTAERERAGKRPLSKILNDIGGWPVLLGNAWNEREYNWMLAVFKIMDQQFAEYYFPASIAVASDNDDSSKNTLRIGSVSLHIDRNYFLEGQSHLLTAYFDNMIRIVTALGAPNDSRTRQEMQEVLDFEVKLFNLTTPQEKLEEMSEEKTNIAGLHLKYPGIPWLQFINRALRAANIYVDGSEKVYVTDPNFVAGVVKLARYTPKRIIGNYLAWSFTKSLTQYLSVEFDDIDFELEKVVKGKTEKDSRIVLCFEDTLENFPVGVSAMFVRKHFDKSFTTPVAELFSNLKTAFGKTLQETEWMDDITRRAALEKLQAMNVTIGFAKELLDDHKVDEYYKDLQINPGLYLRSAFNVTNYVQTQIYKSLRDFSGRNKWTRKQSAAVINAYYMVDENNIEMPAGLLKVFYNKDRPQYINYGVVGTIVGHEAVHGFDNTGRKYDKHGNQASWWQPSTERKFREKSRCLVEQYNNFTVSEINMNVNGELTQGENIADNGGFRAAYLAYNEWAKQNNIVESCIPTFNYTPQQMFWISAASTWCSKKLPESLRDDITDEHSPNSARIIITFSNIKEFAKDFNCPINSRMNPEKKCKTW